MVHPVTTDITKLRLSSRQLCESRKNQDIQYFKNRIKVEKHKENVGQK